MEAALEVAVEVAILVAVALPFARLAACPPFLRRMGGAPEMAVLGIAVLAGYFVTIGVIAVLSLALLRPLAVAAVAAAAFAIWRARSTYGRQRGLPPGVLRIAPLGPWTDQDYYAADARRFGPIFKTSTMIGPLACVVGLPAALDLFENHDAKMVPPANRFGRFIPRGFIRSMADEDHDRYAPVLRSALSGAIVRAAEPELRLIIRAQISQAESQPLRELTWTIVFRAYLRLFFGIGPNDPDLPRLEYLYRRMDPLRAWRSTPGSIQRAVDEAAAIVEGRSSVEQDTFMAAARRAHPAEGSDATLTKNLVYLAHTAGADVAGLLAWVVSKLSAEGRPDVRWIGRLRTDERPERLAKRIVQETLRLEQSEFIMRRATSDIRWRGYLIPKGWRVRICVRESHRDPNVFADPDSFNPDRWADETPARDRYSPFGAATTRATCLGEGLTMTIGRLFVEELTLGFDWTLDGPTTPEFSGIHWRPNSGIRFSATARQAAATRHEHASPDARAA